MDEKTPSLEELRQSIDSVDKQLLELIEERAALAGNVAKAKRATQANPVYYRPEREAQIIRNKLANYQGALNKPDVAQVFKDIISSCRALQKQHTVAYLGPEGTFSHSAVQQHFGASEKVLGKQSITAVFHAVESEEADYGVVPIENSTTGVINETIDNLLTSRVKLCGETQVSIRFHLLSKLSNLSEIKTLYVHPQAAMQCKHWLESHLPKVMQKTTSSNAESARLAAADETGAALAGDIAAELYGLEKLANNVQDSTSNTTRFVVIGKESVPASGEDKTSLLITGTHKPGALWKILQPLAEAEINISLITSRPRRGTEQWRYFFFIDLDAHQDNENFKQAINSMQNQAVDLKVLGSYPKMISTENI
jgi:chorismate mutase/prephenate dehydratase